MLYSGKPLLKSSVGNVVILRRYHKFAIEVDNAPLAIMPNPGKTVLKPTSGFKSARYCNDPVSFYISPALSERHWASIVTDSLNREILVRTEHDPTRRIDQTVAPLVVLKKRNIGHAVFEGRRHHEVEAAQSDLGKCASGPVDEVAANPEEALAPVWYAKILLVIWKFRHEQQFSGVVNKPETSPNMDGKPIGLRFYSGFRLFRKSIAASVFIIVATAPRHNNHRHRDESKHRNKTLFFVVGEAPFLCELRRIAAKFATALYLTILHGGEATKAVLLCQSWLAEAFPISDILLETALVPVLCACGTRVRGGIPPFLAAGKPLGRWFLLHHMEKACLRGSPENKARGKSLVPSWLRVALPRSSRTRLSPP